MKYVFGHCPFCATKGYPKRKLVVAHDGLRCMSCMSRVESFADAVDRILARDKSPK